MIRNISIGISVGSMTTRVVVRELGKEKSGEEKTPKILGVGEVETKGVRRGVIVQFDEAAQSVRAAVEAAERASGVKIKKAYVALSGQTLRSETATGAVVISKANGEVTTLDMDKAQAEAEANLNLNNKRIIQNFPISWRLDGKEIAGRLEGMHGTKLEVKTLFITYSTPHLEDLLGVIAEAGVEPIDVIASPLAGANIVLSEKQRIVGTALVDIGAETVSIAIFENGILTALHTFSIGGADITNDIALGLKIPLEKAESLKRGTNDGDSIDYPRKKLDEIIEARLSDIFELVENFLVKIKRNELLPAGVVFVGGGASTKNIENISKEMLNLPSRVGSTEIFGNVKTKLRDPAWFSALGLLMDSGAGMIIGRTGGSGIFSDIKNSIKSSLKQLLP